MEAQKKSYKTQLATVGEDYREAAESNQKTLKKLRDVEAKLAAQDKSYAELKAKLMKASEAEKDKKKDKDGAKSKDKKKNGMSLSEAEVREQWKKKQAAKKKKEAMEKAEKEKAEKLKKEKAEKESKDSKSSKEAKRKKREEELRDEMKKKMSEAESRIREVGKKKVAALIKQGEKEDGKEVKAAKEHIEESVKVSDRKIRARYERKIIKLK